MSKLDAFEQENCLGREVADDETDNAEEYVSMLNEIADNLQELVVQLQLHHGQFSKLIVATLPAENSKTRPS